MTDNPAPDDAAPDNAESLLTRAIGHWHLDRVGSTVAFHVKHFWGAITVHGRFENVDGEGTVEPDGTVSGQLTIDAKSLTTKNRKRDEHLRSADFFDVEHHPTVTITLQRLAPDGEHAFSSHIEVEAAGRRIDLDPTVEVVSANNDAVTLHVSVALDRTAFDMTWSPLGMASREARVEVTARFVRG